MYFVVVLKVQVFGNNRKSKARKGGVCWEQCSANSVEGKVLAQGIFHHREFNRGATCRRRTGLKVCSKCCKRF